MCGGRCGPVAEQNGCSGGRLERRLLRRVAGAVDTALVGRIHVWTRGAAFAMLLAPAAYAGVGVGAWRILEGGASAAATLCGALGFAGGARLLLVQADRLGLSETRRALWVFGGMLALVFWWWLLLGLTN